MYKYSFLCVIRPDQVMWHILGCEGRTKSVINRWWAEQFSTKTIRVGGRLLIENDSELEAGSQTCTTLHRFDTSDFWLFFALGWQKLKKQCKIDVDNKILNTLKYCFKDIRGHEAPHHHHQKRGNLTCQAGGCCAYNTNTTCSSREKYCLLQWGLCLMRLALCFMRLALCFLRLALCFMRLALCFLRLALCFMGLALCFLRLALCFMRLALCFLRLALCFMRLALCFLRLALCFMRLALQLHQAQP